MRSRRGVRRLCLAGSGLFAILAVVPSARAAPATSATPLPLSFAGIANAAGVFQTADRQTGLSATYQTIYGRLPDGFSEYGSEVLQARSAVYFPGDAVVGLGTLLCTAAGQGTPVICNVPKYPLFAQASGGTPDARVASPAPSSGVGPVGVGAANADAHADRLNGVSTNAVMSNYDTPAGSGTLVHVGSVEAHTTQSFDSKAVLTDHAEAKLSGIDLVGGVVHIDGIFVSSTRQTDGKSVHTVAEDFRISGVTAGGLPATIGASGVTINGSGQAKSAVDAANNALKSALSSSGVTIRALGHSATSFLDERRCAAGEEDGLQVNGQEAVSVPQGLPPAALQPILPVPVPVPGLGPVSPSAGQLADVYFVKVVLGGACTDASASAESSSSGSGPSVAPGGSSGGTSTPSGSAGSPSPSGTGGVSASPTVGQPGSPSVGSTAAPAVGLGRTPTAAAGFLQLGLRGHMLRGLYLVMALIMALFAFGARSFLPARLPSGR